jgi:hypothetical protein
MRTLFAIIFAFIFSSTLFAQPPGYLGKRFTLSFDNYVGPNYLNLIGINTISSKHSENYVSTTETSANWNYRWSISMDYVLSKSSSLGLGVSSVNQKMYFDDHYKVINSSGYYDQVYFINNAKLNGFTIGAYLKLFKGQCIAPLGGYVKLEVLYSQFEINTFDPKYINRSEMYKLSKSRMEPISSLGLALTFGKNRIFFNRLVVSTGATVGLRLNLLTSVFEQSSSNPSITAFNSLKKDAQFWHGQNLFYNLHVGVGLLLF